MPFRFGIGKARRYNVSSRNAYVVCVNMLDNQLLECTLTADGTGHDCLQNIAQRINLSEIYYFGLQYINKKLQFRWLDLDRPLKKQLDKSAHNPLLYFRVMFYVADAHTLRNEGTRYQYYLQLKLSVIDGKLPCTPKQAILLGAYSLQAEFGNHDPSKHTVEELHDQLLLPRNMCTEQGTVLRLLTEMLQLHQSLHGVSPDVAEMHYVMEAQQLEGYGLDYFPAKDTSGQEILLGASFIGIFVKYLNGQPANYFKWSDINNLTHSKRNFNIETTLTEKTVRFQMDDPDMVKYVFKMCSLQHKFYHTKQYSVPDTSDSGSLSSPHLRQESLVGTSTDKVGSTGPLPDIQQSVQNYDNSERQQQDLPIVESNPQPEENLYENTQAILEQEYAQNHSPLQEEHYVNEPQYPPSPQQSSTNVFPVRVPSYRPAPDYETIMRQRMDYMAVQQQQERTLHLPNIGRAQVYTQPELLAYSQPEMRMQPQHPNVIHPHQIPSTNTSTNTRVYPITVDRTHSLIIQPTYSTPELYRMSTAPQNVEQNLSPMLSYKLPPPYPRSTSNSYPDLAVQQAPSSPNYHSPDLVSRKNLNNTALLLQSRLDKSMENLAMDVQQQHLHQQQHLLQQQQQQQQMPIHQQTVYSQKVVTEPRAEVQFCSIPPPPRSEPKPDEKEVFITDPPNLHPPSSVPSQFIMSQNAHRPLLETHSNPFDHYGSENPYENLPPAYVHPDIPLHPPVEGIYQNVDELDGNDEIQCIDTTDMGAANHQASDSLLSGTSSVSHVSGPVVVEQPQEPHQLEVKERDIPEPVEDSREGSLSPSQLQVSSVSGMSSSRASGIDSSLDTSRAPKDDRRSLLETKLEEGQVFQEFELIAKKRPKYACTVGEAQNKAKRNRFKDILPYDDTRVILTKSRSNPDGYINASHIKLNLKDKTVHYIAGQGPLEETVNDFWQMVWEQNIHVIAMLTGLEEGGKNKCHSYWPQARGPKNKLKFGDFEIYTKLAQNSGSYVTSQLRMTHKKTKQERAIWHLQYVAWPDHGCPDDTFGFQCYLEEIEAVSRQLDEKDTAAPVLVHCSAGVGRSGVLILTHVMRHCLDLNQDLAVPDALEKMRAQRMHMVQTVTQYTFVYHCLVDYLKSARLI